MKNFKFAPLFLSMTAAIGMVACNSGSSSSSNGSGSSELGVAAITPGASIAESSLWISTVPSTGTWNQYISGTTNGIQAIAANANNILVYDGSNLFMSNANGSQFSQISLPSAPGGNIVSLVAGNNQFVMYSGSSIWSISNSGQITTTNYGGPTISGVSFLNGIYYAYTAESTVYSSTDGNTWNQGSGQNIQPFTNVIQLNTGLYAAMTAPQLNTSQPNLWLGTSPTSFNPESQALENFFNVPAQINFMGTDGKGMLILNETVSLTQQTTREYFIANAQQVNTGAILQVISLPAALKGQKPTGIYFTNNNIFLTSGTMATTNNPSGNLIDPTGPVSVTAVPIVDDAAITSQIVGSPTQTNGTVATTYGNNLLVAPGSNNDGALTMITNANNITAPNYDVLPTGQNTTYATIIGSPSLYMLLLNNGGVLINNGNGFIPANAISNTSNESGSSAITEIDSAGSVNGTFLVQASSLNGGTNGDLYFSQNGNSWTMVSQAALSSANLGTLLAESAVTVNELNNAYNITTSTGTYQTATPAVLSSWVQVPSPTPLFLVNGVTYTLYPGTNNLGTLNGNQYTVTQNALPQNYVSSGNVAYNGSNLIGLEQPATIVEAADKVAGSNYIWTSSTLNGNWTLNFATFKNTSGQALPNEYFNVNPVLIWTGKTWITRGNGNTLLNPNNLPAAIYSSSNILNWQAVSISAEPIMGVPVAF